MQHHMQPLCCSRRRVWLGRHCSQSGNMIHTSSSSLQLPTSAQCLTGCWNCDISHPPCPAACSTVQLITVARCPVSPSLYSRWLRPELTQPNESQPRVITIRQACTWSQVIAAYIPGEVITIKCWSRQALSTVILSSCLTPAGQLD